MKIQIKEIQHKDMTSQSGKPFVSCRIKAYSESQGKDIWLGGFGSSKTKTWEPGDTVDIDIEQRGEYYNWAENDNTTASPDKKLELLKRIDMKLDILLGKNTAKTNVSGEALESMAAQFGGEVVDKSPNGKEEIRVEDIPF